LKAFEGKGIAKHLLSTQAVITLPSLTFQNHTSIVQFNMHQFQFAFGVATPVGLMACACHSAVA